MNNIFMNYKNSKTSDPHRLLLNLIHKINLKTSKRQVVLSNLGIFYNGKIQKSHLRTINLKNRLQHGRNNLNYLMDHILYQIFKIILNMYWKYVNKTENRITFKIKT